MHFENISPTICKQHGWTQVVIQIKYSGYLLGPMAELNTYKSRGRYNYNKVRAGINNTMSVWFELAADATYFKLKYAQ